MDLGHLDASIAQVDGQARIHVVVHITLSHKFGIVLTSYYYSTIKHFAKWKVIIKRVPLVY